MTDVTKHQDNHPYINIYPLRKLESTILQLLKDSLRIVILLYTLQPRKTFAPSIVLVDLLPALRVIQERKRDIQAQFFGRRIEVRNKCPGELVDSCVVGCVVPVDVNKNGCEFGQPSK